MIIVIVICGLVMALAYEMRHRMVTSQLTYLDNEIHRLGEEVKKLKEELTKKQDDDTKKGFKLPFFP